MQRCRPSLGGCWQPFCHLHGDIPGPGGRCGSWTQPCSIRPTRKFLVCELMLSFWLKLFLNWVTHLHFKRPKHKKIIATTHKSDLANVQHHAYYLTVSSSYKRVFINKNTLSQWISPRDFLGIRSWCHCQHCRVVLPADPCLGLKTNKSHMHKIHKSILLEFRVKRWDRIKCSQRKPSDWTLAK